MSNVFYQLLYLKFFCLKCALCLYKINGECFRPQFDTSAVCTTINRFLATDYLSTNCRMLTIPKGKKCLLFLIFSKCYVLQKRKIIELCRLPTLHAVLTVDHWYLTLVYLIRDINDRKVSYTTLKCFLSTYEKVFSWSLTK